MYTIHPKHQWQIYFTLPSKEKKVMQSGFKIQLLFYQTKYSTANLQIIWVDLTSLPWQVTEQKKILKKPRFPSQEGLINDKAVKIQFMSWPLQSPGQAPQPSLMKASCCTTTHLKHELSLLFPRGWDAAASSGMNNCSFLVPGWTCNPSTVSLFKGFPCFSRVTSLVKCYSHS